MSSITINWAGGENDFHLPIGQLRALQQRCDAGPQLILTRLRSGTWMIEDVLETIRLALEGGGLSKPEARRLVTLHCEEKPITLSVLTAQMALMAALYGVDDGDEVGEAQGEADQTNPTSPTDAGASANSTESEPSSDLDPPTSTV